MTVDVELHAPLAGLREPDTACTQQHLVGDAEWRRLMSLLEPDGFFAAFFKNIYFIDVWLSYNVVLISAVWHSDSFIQMYTLLFILFSTTVYSRILTIVPCALQ